LYKNKKKRRILVSPTIGAIIPVGIFHHDPLVAALAAALDFKFFNLLKNMLFQF